MQAFLDSLGDIVKQLDPFNLSNQVLYYAWLVVYSFTWVAVWRSGRPWFRFVCFAVNQLLSVGVLLSAVLTIAIATRYWRESLVAVILTAAISLLLFRRRSWR